MVPYGVMHIEDVHIYIHTKMEEYDHTKMEEYQVNELIGDDFDFKPKFESLTKQKLYVWNNFPNFSL